MFVEARAAGVGRYVPNVDRRAGGGQFVLVEARAVGVACAGGGRCVLKAP